MKARTRDFNDITRIVVKIGTSTLTKKNGDVDAVWARQLARQVVALKRGGKEVILVSSGAIGAGRFVLDLGQRPRSLAEKQAVAAVGQPRLMRVYKDAFRRLDTPVAQLLLTYDDLDSRLRYRNAANTLNTLLAMGVVPIINENDTVAVEEIKFGDNDYLSALVFELSNAGLLILLTDVDGVLDEAKQVRPQLTAAEAERLIAEKIATGGMQAKLNAAVSALRQGVGEVRIARGSAPSVIQRVLGGEDLGTRMAL